MPKVSVIIPVYNTGKYLKRCLESICNQTLESIEIICINDCSTDDSFDILLDYSKKDNRIKLINLTHNKGVAAARNIGIEKSSGEYIGFVDSDDYISLDFYDKLYKKATDYEADVAKGNIYNCDNHGQHPTLTSFYNMNDKIRNNKIYFYYGFTSAIYKREFIVSHNIKFPENISHFEDPFFSIQVAIYSNFVAFDDSSSYFYVKHESSACASSKTLNKAVDFTKSVMSIFDIINNVAISKKEFFIILSFLYEQVEPWCYDLSLPEQANILAQDVVINILNNKYGFESFLRFYYSEKNSLSRFRLNKNKKFLLNLLRKKVMVNG